MARIPRLTADGEPAVYHVGMGDVAGLFGLEQVSQPSRSNSYFPAYHAPRPVSDLC
jgi:hypothetical protein